MVSMKRRSISFSNPGDLCLFGLVALFIGMVVAGGVLIGIAKPAMDAVQSYKNAVSAWTSGGYSPWTSFQGPISVRGDSAAVIELERYAFGSPGFIEDSPAVTGGESMPSYNEKMRFGIQVSDLFTVPSSVTFGTYISRNITLFDSNGNVFLEGNFSVSYPFTYTPDECITNASSQKCRGAPCVGQKPSSARCRVQVKVSSVCVSVNQTIIVKLKNGQTISPPLQLSSLEGCAANPGPWSFQQDVSIYKKEILPGGEGTTFDITGAGSMYVTLRAEADPYIKALSVTEGTNAFKSRGGLFYAGIALLCIAGLMVFAFIAYLVMICRNTAREKNKPKAPYTTVVMAPMPA